MKQNNTKYSTKSLNPFLGFGWSTTIKYPERVQVIKNQQLISYNQINVTV